MPFQIIYLNGASSSGKTTLAKDLQNAFEEPFLHIGIDRIINWMPEKYNDWTGEKQDTPGYSWKKSSDDTGAPMQELIIGPYAEEIGRIFQEVVLTLAQMGHRLIIDDVSIEKKEIDSWKELLKDFSVLWVGVHAPLSVLEEREKNRKDRIIGSARGQFHKVHQNATYDIEIDTHASSFQEIFEKITSFPCHYKEPLEKLTRTCIYGIVEKNNSLLLITQKTGPYKGLFDFPGGKIEFGESFEEALKREFLEEVGMTFASMELNTTLSSVFTFSKKVFYHIGLIYTVQGLRACQKATLSSTWVEKDTLKEDMVSPFVWQMLLKKNS